MSCRHTVAAVSSRFLETRTIAGNHHDTNARKINERRLLTFLIITSDTRVTAGYGMIDSQETDGLFVEQRRSGLRDRGHGGRERRVKKIVTVTVTLAYWLPSHVEHVKPVSKLGFRSRDRRYGRVVLPQPAYERCFKKNSESNRLPVSTHKVTT
jgi:transposase